MAVAAADTRPTDMKKISLKLATLCVATVALLVLSLVVNWRDVGDFWSYINVAKMLLAGLIAYIVVFWQTPATQQYTLFRWFATIAVPLFAVLATIILLVNPNLAELLVRENHALENTQAWFMFAGALLLFIATVRLARLGRKIEAVGALLIGVALFCIGGEEISWGMWLFDAHANEFFAAHNAQSETNFHNMDTFFSEDLYYFGAFAWLVLVPFMRDRVAKFLKKVKLPRLESLLPSAWMFIPWAVMAGFVAPYSYKQTTILVGLIVSLLILVHTISTSAALHKSRAFGATGILVLLLVVWCVDTFSAQSILIDHIRGGSPKEYMETIIAFGMVTYAVDVYVRLFVTGLQDKKPLIKRILSR